MKLQTQKQLENTQRKLAGLERQYGQCQKRPIENAAARKATLISLKRAINQLKEEITLYQIAQGSPAK